MAEKKAAVKKVAPYPIDVLMTIGGQQGRGHILKLALVGVLVDLRQSVVHVGQQLTVAFTLPVMNISVTVPAKVVKTYDKLATPPAAKVEFPGDESQPTPPAPSSASAPSPSSAATKGKVVQRIAELHFMGLSNDSKGAIVKFLKAIRQADGLM